MFHKFRLAIVIMLMLLAGVTRAYALYYCGGGYDGYDVKLGSNSDIVNISSAADQTFTFGDSATVISAITVTVDAGQITATNDIRVKIPAALDMTWDTTVATATITGDASAKVSTTVTYESSGRTLVIDVTTNFAIGDSIIISDLSFKNFNSVEYSNLTLSIDGGAATTAIDDKKKTISLSASTATFTGGSYDGYAFGWNSDAELSFFLLFE